MASENPTAPHICPKTAEKGDSTTPSTQPTLNTASSSINQPNVAGNEGQAGQKKKRKRQPRKKKVKETSQEAEDSTTQETPEIGENTEGASFAEDGPEDTQNPPNDDSTEIPAENGTANATESQQKEIHNTETKGKGKEVQSVRMQESQNTEDARAPQGPDTTQDPSVNQLPEAPTNDNIPNGATQDPAIKLTRSQRRNLTKRERKKAAQAAKKAANAEKPDNVSNTTKTSEAQTTSTPDVQAAVVPNVVQEQASDPADEAVKNTPEPLASPAVSHPAPDTEKAKAADTTDGTTAGFASPLIDSALDQLKWQDIGQQDKKNKAAKKDLTTSPISQSTHDVEEPEVADMTDRVTTGLASSIFGSPIDPLEILKGLSHVGQQVETNEAAEENTPSSPANQPTPDAVDTDVTDTNGQTGDVVSNVQKPVTSSPNDSQSWMPKLPKKLRFWGQSSRNDSMRHGRPVMDPETSTPRPESSQGQPDEGSHKVVAPTVTPPKDKDPVVKHMEEQFDAWAHAFFRFIHSIYETLFASSRTIVKAIFLS
ncbi:MAG: hypothetical protein Q9218_006612 [Villophora microphyllina]